MSEVILSCSQADAGVEQARSTVEEAARTLDAVRVALDTAHAEVARLDALPVLESGDLLNLENARRYVRTLETELPEREDAHAAALAALAEADREAHRAHMLEAHAGALALVAPIAKVVAKFTEKVCPMLAALRERVAVAAEHAVAAREPVPHLPGIGDRLADVDATDEAAVLLALGSAITAEREHAAYLAELDRDAADRAAEASRAEAELAAWAALPQAERDAILRARFDEAVERFRHIHPGYQIDAARRVVARSAWNPYGPVSRFNPYQREPEVAPVEVDEAAENRRVLDAHHERLADAAAMRDATGDYDPFASR